MTALRDLLTAQIAATGPIGLAEYMATCLLHPTHGYYTTRDPLGQTGDFTTAPEISQMFGELIGLCLAQAWMDQGEPDRFALTELGPGRGTLMSDILRATATVPGFSRAAEVHLVEVSPTLRTRQQDLVEQATWHDNLDTVPELPIFLVANEFFDALPIRQFIRDRDGWRERQVGLRAGELTFGLSAPMPPDTLPNRLGDTGQGDIVEVCHAAEPIASQIGHRLVDHGGAALIIDYGNAPPDGDTFQAVAEHEMVDPLAAPGQADLTAHVDFAALVSAARPSVGTVVTPQGAFLERLGITARAQALARGLSGEALTSHIAAHRRLTHPDEMGHLFKVLGLTAPGTPPPPGLEARPEP